MIQFLADHIYIFTTCFALLLMLWFIFIQYPKYTIRILEIYNRLKSGLRIRYLFIHESLTICYTERGDSSVSPTILFIHGFSGSKLNFSVPIGFLPDNFHVIAIDLPGHGGSTQRDNEDCSVNGFVDIIKQVVDLLGLSEKKFHLVGFSMGGMISGLYASKFSDDLLSVTMSSPPGIHIDKKTKIETAYDEGGRIMLLPSTANEVREMLDHLMYRKISLPWFIVNGILQITLEKQAFCSKVIDANKENFRYALEPELHKITCPVLLLWGRHDQVVHVDCVEVIRKTLPREPKHIEIFETCGHVNLLERPRKVVHVICKFIESLQFCV